VDLYRQWISWLHQRKSGTEEEQQMNTMYKTNKLANQSRYLMWFMALLLSSVIAGCGGGSESGDVDRGSEMRDPILGNPVATIIPTVTATAPLATTPIVTGVAVNSNVVATFSKDMNPTTISTSSFTLACPSGSAIAGAVSYVEASRVATFNPTNNLPANTICTATITTGAQDIAGVALASNFIWSFRTSSSPDTTRPRVTITVPDDAASGVATNTAITATFTEDMDAATITGSSFTLTGPGVTVVAGNVSYSVAARTATFTPTTPATLPANTLFTATITIAATDLAGNALAGNQAALPAASNYVWTFTTGAAPDTVAPTITLENPAHLATGVAINANVNATFSEPMDPLTLTNITFTLQETGPPLGSLINGIVTYDVPSRVATFNPQSDLLENTNYTATVTSAATDLAGNNLVAGLLPNPWTFTTAAAAPPPALAINLGAAESFGLASRAGLTSTGVTVVNGDIALHPLASCTDSTGNAGASQTCLVQTYSSPTGMTVNGSIYWAGDPFDNGATALQVTDDLNTAWVEGQNKIDTFATGFLGGELGGPGPAGKVLLPGVYHEAALGLSAGSVVTFDALGDANAIFIIKVDSSFVDSGTLLLPTEVKLETGAQARNIWFITGLDATIGSGTTWFGNILAGRTIVINDGSTVTGRALGGASGAGAVTLTGAASPSVTTVTVPSP
jgi:hypothetical protein